MRAALAVALPLLVLTSACSGTPSATVTVTSTATTTATVTSTATVTATPTVSASPTVVAVARCTAGQLAMGLGSSNGTAGSVYQAIRFTNKSSRACTLTGHPGVSFVAAGSGSQVGAAASHSATPPTTTVTLMTADSASALLRTVDYGNYSSAACVAKPVGGLRIFPPGSTVSVVLDLPSGSMACSTKVAQLSVGAVVKGTTGQ
jgi:hypothetical protein